MCLKCICAFLISGHTILTFFFKQAIRIMGDNLCSYVVFGSCCDINQKLNHLIKLVISSDPNFNLLLGLCQIRKSCKKIINYKYHISGSSRVNTLV